MKGAGALDRSTGVDPTAGSRRRGNSLMSDTPAKTDMRASTGLIWAVLVAFIVALAPSAFAQPPAPPKPAVPLDALAAIVDAFKSHSLVALGETHGHLERQAFLHNLIADSRFAAVANDIVVEGGSSSCQELVDRFVSGEDVPLESLQRVWRNTTEGQAVPRNLVEVFQLVREIKLDAAEGAPAQSPARRSRRSTGIAPIRPPIGIGLLPDWSNARCSNEDDEPCRPVRRRSFRAPDRVPFARDVAGA